MEKKDIATAETTAIAEQLLKIVERRAIVDIIHTFKLAGIDTLTEKNAEDILINIGLIIAKRHGGLV